MMTNTFLPNLVNATVLFYGGTLVLIGHMSAGSLVSFMLYQQSLAAALQVSIPSEILITESEVDALALQPGGQCTGVRSACILHHMLLVQPMFQIHLVHVLSEITDLCSQWAMFSAR